MKVLIVNTFDAQAGGAARAAYRLHQALLAANIDSTMLVQHTNCDDPNVLGLATKMTKGLIEVGAIIDEIPVKFYPKKNQTYFSVNYLFFNQIIKKINQINPDIVHLHWICRGMLKISDLAKIKQPIVWSLHDMWAFTGGCHYDGTCGRYKENCGQCQVLGSHQKNDLSTRILKKKRQSFEMKNNLVIVGLSQWLATTAKESTLFKNKKVINLPNPIDTHLFKPFDKQHARQLWQLPQGKRLILFGAINATGDPRKGYKKLITALRKLQYKDVELVIFGSNRPKDQPNFSLKTRYVGHLHDDVSLVTLYSACDVMVVPSLQENLSNAIMESLSCGTPVVAFDIGGNGDMIKHQQNGYLAKPFDSNDLAHGIEWIIDNETRHKKISSFARKMVVNTFDSKKVAKQYIKLYHETIAKSHV